MRILITTYQGGVAGATYSISYLAKGLAQRGHQIYLAGMQDSLLFQLLEGTDVKLISMPFRSKTDRQTMQMLRDLIRKKGIEIVNAQSSKDRYLTIFSRWLYKLPVKIIHTRRQYPKSAGGKIHSNFYVWGTDKIIVVSEELKNIFIRKGYPSNHLQVINNGTPSEQYLNIDQERIAELRERFDIQKDNTVIGCVSRMKEQPQLIKALQYLDDSIKVIFAGINEGSLNKYINQYGIKNPIIYAGTLSKKDTLHLYKLLDVNVLASVMDGFGLVLVEAMALGVPVVATNFGGIKSVVTHGENGLLFENNDVRALANQLKWVLNDHSIREKLIQNGRLTALEKFSVEKTVENHETLFKSLLGD